MSSCGTGIGTCIERSYRIIMLLVKFRFIKLLLSFLHTCVLYMNSKAKGHYYSMMDDLKRVFVGKKKQSRKQSS